MTSGDAALLAEILARHPNDEVVYRLCEHYLARYDNENNWEPDTNGEVALLLKVLPRCRIVFDVGSHTGDWAAAALRLNPALEVHCFEASPTTHRLLVERTPPLPVIANPFGLGAVAETRVLYSFGAGSNANSLYRRSRPRARPRPRSSIRRTRTAPAGASRRSIT